MCVRNPQVRIRHWEPAGSPDLCYLHTGQASCREGGGGEKLTAISKVLKQNTLLGDREEMGIL